MKKILTFILIIFIMASSYGYATLSHELKPYVGSPELEQLKTLAGTWQGTTTEMNGQKADSSVEYFVTSNGSAVVEKLFPGTPNEMISVYHDKNRKLSMTHYCGLGNQPQMDLISSTPQELKFEFSPSSNIDASKEAHMHSLTLHFDGNDKLVQSWTYFQNGAQAGSCVISLTRKK